LKRISKNKIEFDCIVKAVTPIETSEDDADKIDMYIHYFDRDDDLNLVIRGKYNSEHLEYLQKAAKEMRVVTLTLTVKEGTL